MSYDLDLLLAADRHVYAVGEHPDDWLGISSWERYEYVWDPCDHTTTDPEGRPY